MLLKDDHWFGPEDIAGLTEAFEGALSKLVNRDDPTTLTVAKLIIHLAKEGERDPGATARSCGGDFLKLDRSLCNANVSLTDLIKS